MNIFKLGCKWDNQNNGGQSPLFFDFLVKEGIVIGTYDQNYSSGDIVVLTDGFTVIGIAEVTSDSIGIIDEPEFEEPCKKYNIHYEDWVLFSYAKIHVLAENDKFPYQTRQGMVSIQNDSVRKQTIILLKKYRREATMENYLSLLKANYNLILTGAPGTGKTYLAQQLAYKLVFGKEPKTGLSEKAKRELKESGRYKFVQFHPSYDYADFVEGVKPSDLSEGIKFEVRAGVFKEFCKKALDAWNADQDKEEAQRRKFVFIIDEINRADLSRVFGELFFGLEADYRGEEITTQYSYLHLREDQGNLIIPKNLYIIGTMNDIDRSVESMDFALRRRFVWKEISAESSKTIIDSANISKELKEQAKIRMDKLNAEILETFGSTAYQIGGAYFKKLELYKDDDGSGFAALWENHLENVLREYLRGDRNLEVKLNALKAAYNNE